MKLDRSWVRSMPLWVIGIGSSLVVSTGCQQWSLRESTAGLFGPMEETDDWAPPTDIVYQPQESEDGMGDPKGKQLKKGQNRWWSNSKNAPPPPRVILPKDRESKKKTAETAAQTPAKDRSTKDEVKSTEIKTPSVLGYGTNPNGSPGVSVKAGSASPNASIAVQTPSAPMQSITANSQNESKPSTSVATTGTASAAPLVDTGVRDVDIEGALRSLPPEYRDVVRQSIASLQRAESGTTSTPIASTPATSSSDANSSAAAIASAPKPDLPPASTVATAPEKNASENASGTALPPALPARTLPPSSESMLSSAASSVTNGTTTTSPSDSARTTDVKSADYKPGGGGSTASPGESITVRLGGDNSSDSKVVPSGHVDRGQGHSTAQSDIHGTALRSPDHGSSPSIPWRQQTSLAIEALERELANAPPADPSLRVSQELTLRMMYVAQRRLEDAIRPIEDLSEREQEYIQHEMKALYDASNPDANPSKARHWSQVMISQRQATENLSALSNLEVRGLAFCDEVRGYGMLERCKKNQFAPDQDVLLYCEIDNVTAERVKAGYETQLQGSYEILDSQKRRITEQLLPMEPELCQNHRRDYYIVYRIFMPQQIQPGRHELVLAIEDMKGHKFGKATVEFEIRKP